jgi:hypothetical protein
MAEEAGVGPCRCQARTPHPAVVATPTKPYVPVLTLDDLAAWLGSEHDDAALRAKVEALEREVVRLKDKWQERRTNLIEYYEAQLAAMKQERDEAERRGMERAAEAVLQTVIKFDVDWLRTATKAEAITETLRQASAALRGETGGG